MVHSEAESRISGDSRCSGKIRSASSASLRAQLCDNVRRPPENIPTSPCTPTYNLVAIPVAAGLFVRWGLDLPMSVGAVAMSLSTIIVAANAQLLRRLKLQH